MSAHQTLPAPETTDDFNIRRRNILFFKWRALKNVNAECIFRIESSAFLLALVKCPARVKRCSISLLPKKLTVCCADYVCNETDNLDVCGPSGSINFHM